MLAHLKLLQCPDNTNLAFKAFIAEHLQEHVCGTLIHGSHYFQLRGAESLQHPAVNSGITRLVQCLALYQTGVNVLMAAKLFIF